jgi:hypothetical protein
MGADLGNVSTRFEDTSSSSSSDLGSVSTGVVRVVDKIIGSTVIPRRNVVDVKSAPVIEKFSSPNIVKPSISATPINSGGMFTPSPEELQAMTAKSTDSTDVATTATNAVNNVVSTAKSNPLVMYAAIGIGAFLIYKYFIK